MTTITTESELDAYLKSGRPVVLKFGAQWCAPCRKLNESLRDVEAGMPGVDFLSASVDEAMGLANAYNVMTVPLVVIFKGGVPSGSFQGNLPVTEMTDKIRDAAGV